MKVFLSLCLLFCLVSPAVLLTCEYCKNSTGVECSYRDSDACPFDELDSLCKSMVVDGSEHFNISKAMYLCSYKVLCDAGHYAITTANGRSFDMVVYCCHFNMCNSKRQELPLKKMEPNGLECVGCYSENKEKCEGTEVVKCRGDQTKCIKMSISYQKRRTGIQAQVALRGCATPIMCDKGKVMRNTVTTLLMMYTMTVQCADAL